MKRTIVTTTIPYSLIWDDEDFEILVNGRVFEVHFERKGRQRGNEEVTGSGIVEASGFTLPKIAWVASLILQWKYAFRYTYTARLVTTKN